MDRGVDVKELVGMKEEDAVKLIERAGLRVRYSSRDGEVYALTQDFWIDRISLDIVDGKVVNAVIG